MQKFFIFVGLFLTLLPCPHGHKKYDILLVLFVKKTIFRKYLSVWKTTKFGGDIKSKILPNIQRGRVTRLKLNIYFILCYVDLNLQQIIWWRKCIIFFDTFRLLESLMSCEIIWPNQRRLFLYKFTIKNLKLNYESNVETNWMVAIFLPALFKKFRKINSQNSKCTIFATIFLAKISNESIFIYYQTNLSDRPELYTFDWYNCMEMAR